MKAAIKKLLERRVQPCHDVPADTRLLEEVEKRLGWVLPDNYKDLLTQCNGGYFLDDALHLYGIGMAEETEDLVKWNEPALWKAGYGKWAENLIFFGEDAYGNQFAFNTRLSGQVELFFCETGSTEYVGSRFEDFCRLAVEREADLLATPFLRAFQEKESLLPGQHLDFIIPLALGGKETWENAQKMQAVAHMHACSKIARQIHNLPPGTPISEVVLED